MSVSRSKKVTAGHQTPGRGTQLGGDSEAIVAGFFGCGDFHNPFDSVRSFLGYLEGKTPGLSLLLYVCRFMITVMYLTDLAPICQVGPRMVPNISTSSSSWNNSV